MTDIPAGGSFLFGTGRQVTLNSVSTIGNQELPNTSQGVETRAQQILNGLFGTPTPQVGLVYSPGGSGSVPVTDITFSDFVYPTTTPATVPPWVNFGGIPGPQKYFIVYPHLNVASSAQPRPLDGYYRVLVENTPAFNDGGIWFKSIVFFDVSLAGFNIVAGGDPDPEPCPKPDAPSSLSIVSDDTNRQHCLQWTAVEGAENYGLYCDGQWLRNTPRTSAYVRYDDSAGVGGSRVETPQHVFSVTAVNGCGESVPRFAAGKEAFND